MGDSLQGVSTPLRWGKRGGKQKKLDSLLLVSRIEFTDIHLWMSWASLTKEEKYRVSICISCEWGQPTISGFQIQGRGRSYMVG